MKKTTLIKLLCLAIACLLIVPMVIACDKEDGTEETKGNVVITFKLRGGDLVDGEEEIEVEFGGKLRKAQRPSVEKEGYVFKCWAYDVNGNTEYESSDTFEEDTTLYAIWEKDVSGENNNNNTTPSTGDNTQNPDVPSVTEKVTVEFNTGSGYFENPDDYEKEINKGGRLSAFPKPIHENAAMAFDGWYKDAALTMGASLSDKYEANTTLYAGWIEQAECSDGSYNHSYTGWDTDSQPTCDRPGTFARYCEYCNDKQTKVGDPAKGHSYGQWQEAFMARERICNRPGCGNTEIVSFANITTSLLGNTPATQIEGSTANFYNVPFTNLINNRWDEGHGEFVGPKGTGDCYVQFNFLEATALDRIYFKGEGVTTISILVQYEGEDDFTLVGVCGGASSKEATPFVVPDSTKKISSVKFTESSPPNGTSKWQEVAFVKESVAE